MKKKELTPEEIAQKKEIASFNRRYAGFKRTLKTQASERGIRSIELELEFLKAHPNTQLPKSFMNHEQTMKCYAEAISEYKGEKAAAA